MQFQFTGYSVEISESGYQILLSIGRDEQSKFIPVAEIRPIEDEDKMSPLPLYEGTSVPRFNSIDEALEYAENEARVRVCRRLNDQLGIIPEDKSGA